MIRLEMTKKQEAILAAIIVVAAIGAFVLYSWVGQPPTPVVPDTPPPVADVVTS